MTNSSPQSSGPTTNTDIDGPLLACMGRWVTIYNDVHGPIRRSILPRYAKHVCGDEAHVIVEPLLRLISGREDLGSLILLVTPTSKKNFNHKLHCFDRETHGHLGSTCTTKNEVTLMRQYQMLLKYEMVFTHEYLPIKTLATDSSIIAQLVQSSRVAVLLKGEEEPQLKIKSLREPKIPVRLRRGDIKRHEKKPNEKQDEAAEPVWKI